MGLQFVRRDMRPGSSRVVVQKAAVDLIQSLGAVAGANQHGADGPARRHLGRGRVGIERAFAEGKPD